VELRLRPDQGVESDWRAWQIHVAGFTLPMREERDRRGELRVFGLRYRSCIPAWGLHPALGCQAPVRLRLRHPRHTADHVVTLHEWRPDGEAYAGLPEDLASSSQRRAERMAREVLPRDSDVTRRPPPGHGLGSYCLDLRTLFCTNQVAVHHGSAPL